MIAWLLSILRVCALFFTRLFPVLARYIAVSVSWSAAIVARLNNSLLFHVVLNALLVAAMVQFFTYSLFTWLGDMLSTYVLSFDIINSYIPDLGGFAVLIWDSGLNLKQAAFETWQCLLWVLSAYVTEFFLRRVFWATINTTYRIRGLS